LIYGHEYNFQEDNARQSIWDKARCYWEQLGNLGKMVRTWWEHIRNNKNPKKPSYLICFPPLDVECTGYLVTKS
jgi:hypothetical protein